MDTIITQFKTFFNNIRVSIVRSATEFYQSICNLVGEQLAKIILIVGVFLIIYIIMHTFLNRK